jgi:hypothetical protein
MKPIFVLNYCAYNIYMRIEVPSHFANWQHHTANGVVLHSWRGAETASVRGLAETAKDRVSLVSFQSPSTAGYVILRVGAGPLLVPTARFELLTSPVIIETSFNVEENID